MSGPIGDIPEFGGEDWGAFLERLDQYFEVNNIGEDKRVGLLINAIGAETYQILRDLCHPTLPKEKPFAELCELLGKHMNPPTSVFRERSTFYNAQQENDENITAWYGRIKGLAVDCKFGTHFESALVDKFITGLKPGAVADRLREEDETIGLQTALDIALNKEAAAIDGAETVTDSSSDDETNNQGLGMRRCWFGRHRHRQSSRERSPHHGPPNWSHSHGGPPHRRHSHHGPMNWPDSRGSPPHRRDNSPHHGPPHHGPPHHGPPHHGPPNCFDFRGRSPHGPPNWSDFRAGPPHCRENSPHCRKRQKQSMFGHGRGHGKHFGKGKRGKHDGHKSHHHKCHHGEHHHFGRENFRI